SPGDRLTPDVSCSPSSRKQTACGRPRLDSLEALSHWIPWESIQFFPSNSGDALCDCGRGRRYSPSLMPSSCSPCYDGFFDHDQCCESEDFKLECVEYLPVRRR